MSFTQTGQIASVQASNQKMPLGNRVLALAFNVTVSPGSPYTLDITNNMATGQIDQIQSAYIDNTGGTTDFLLVNAYSRMSISVPPGMQGWFPIIAGYPPQQFLCSGDGTIPVFLANVPMPVGCWGPSQVTVSGTVAVSGTVSVLDSQVLAALESVIETLPNGDKAIVEGSPAIAPGNPTSFSVVHGGTAVPVFNALSLNIGGIVTNPIEATESLFIDIVNTPGTVAPGANGTTFELVPGQPFIVPPNISTAVEVNAVTSGHSFTAVAL
jgi:hypothetical protein